MPFNFTKSFTIVLNAHTLTEITHIRLPSSHIYIDGPPTGI